MIYDGVWDSSTALLTLELGCCGSTTILLFALPLLSINYDEREGQVRVVMGPHARQVGGEGAKTT